MPWKEATAMSERSEFIEKVVQGENSFSTLCKEYGISRTSGYKWVRRYAEAGEAGLRNSHAVPMAVPIRQPPRSKQPFFLCVRSTRVGVG